MCRQILLDPELRGMTYHRPLPRAWPRAWPSTHKILQFGASVSVFALTLGASGSLNAPQGFSPAFAAEDAGSPFADMTPMNEAALDEARGGFSVGNVNVNVGVQVETSIDGFVTVTTNFNVTMPGMLENMGTEIKTVAEAATQAATAAINAANASVAAATANAASEWQTAATADAADSSQTDSTNQTSGTNQTPATNQNTATNIPNTRPDTVVIGDMSVASQTVNGTPTNPVPDATATSLQNNPTVVQAIETLNQGVKTVLGDSLTPYTAEPPTQTSTPVVSVVATTDNSTHNNGGGNVDVSALTKDGNKLVIPTTTANMAQVIHDTSNGHTSIITNTMNNVTIRQSVSMNMTVDNFSSLQNVSSLNRVVASLSRQIGLMGLRH